MESDSSSKRPSKWDENSDVFSGLPIEFISLDDSRSDKKKKALAVLDTNVKLDDSHDQKKELGVNVDRDRIQTSTNRKEIDRDVMILFNHPPDPSQPNAYSLYNINVSYPATPPSLAPDFDVKSSAAFASPHIIEPILQIPSGKDLPENMCCVMLKSKLYFLGGIIDGTFASADVYVVDLDYDYLSTSQLILQKNVAGSLISGKPKPYAFVAKNKIFVMNNHQSSHSHDFSFEVFSPLRRRLKRRRSKPSRKLPDPPIDFVVAGHAVVGDSLFLTGRACREGCEVVVCLSLVNGYRWDKRFVQSFLPEHAFYGEGHMVGETMYALSGFNGTIPAAYNLSAERLKSADLFEDCALLTPALEAVHEHVFYDWLESSLLHVGDGIFCYISTGEFPHDSSPEYSGVNLTVFKPTEGTFSEIICDCKANSFTGEFLSFAHLKFNFSHPRDIGAFQGCFFVPRDGADRIQNLGNVGVVQDYQKYPQIPQVLSGFRTLSTAKRPPLRRQGQSESKAASSFSLVEDTKQARDQKKN